MCRDVEKVFSGEKISLENGVKTGHNILALAESYRHSRALPNDSSASGGFAEAK